MPLLLWMSVAFAGKQGAAVAKGAFGLAPSLADTQAGAGGLAFTSTRSTLLESVDPELQTPWTAPAPGLWATAFGTGPAQYGFGMTLFLPSRPVTEGEVAAWQIAGTQIHYYSGFNLLSLAEREDRFGFSPGVVVQAGIGGGVQSEVARKGMVYFMDAAHIHVGMGLGAYVVGDDVRVTVYGGYMPEPLSALTLGFVEGSGRYDPEYLGTDQYDTDDPNQVPTVLNYILVTSNDIDVRRDYYVELKVQWELVFLTYGMRRYDLSGAAGHELRDDATWSNIRHTVGIGFGGAE